MVMVVANAILEACGGASRLNASKQPFRDEHRQGVVDRLRRDSTDFGPGRQGHFVRRRMGLHRDRPQDGQPLRRYLNAVLPEEFDRVV